MIATLVLGLSMAGLWLSSTKSSDAESEPASPAEIAARDDALTRARVLLDEPFAGPRVDFSADPNAGVVDLTETTCTFVPNELHGTTPKFDCRLPNGETVKVKYGWTREIPAELAATRLLNGLGFPADRMSRVEKVRCYGCVISPFHMRLAAAWFKLRKVFDRGLDYEHATTFSDVAVERKFPGESIDTSAAKGWAFYELSRIDPKRGGATRAEVDALRLVSVFLSHWDNKAENQRLVCVDNRTPCSRPIAMLQDLGSDFGPYKVDVEAWGRTPIWADAGTCTLSMKAMPYDGATFQTVQISDAGRRLLADRLRQFSRSQIESLFKTAGFEHVESWVSAFENKVRQIADISACPSAAGAASS